ncbi:MAG: UDP-N-acetylmuramate--L-alanine ligase [Clostridia bacterium]|nr:UDP-N-acetylmuramate--L-alanine ligase [Clostridia bacterium]
MSAQITDYQGKHVHIIGIMGASLCGLAELLHQQGYQVTGSDMKTTIFTPYVRKTGIPFTIGHSEENVKGADLVVFSAAVPPTNIEYAYAVEHGIPVMERATLVGQIMQQHKQAIGISGCHGKTTITSLLGLMFLLGEQDPTVHVGGVLDYLGEGGTRLGGGDVMVVESCEYRDSFLQFFPTVAVVNNIDDDHPDYFSSIEQAEQSYENFVARLPENGVMVGCYDDPRVRALMERCGKKTVSFGLSPEADWTAEAIEYDGQGNASFVPVHNGTKLERVYLNLPGAYNVANALCALCVATMFGVSEQAQREACASYHAAERRFQFHGTVDDVNVYHDFAHHPTAVAKCMEAALNVPHKKLWTVFQCNSFSRMHQFFDRFVEAFLPADCIIVAEIFPGREKDTGLVHGSQMVDALKGLGKESYYIPTFDQIGAFLRERWQPGDMVLMVGSGNINEYVWQILGEDGPRAL